MAIFRKIHVSFWEDSFVSELNTTQKLFYIYLLTNSKTSQCGIYEITKKKMSFDLGYSIDTVSKLIKYFIFKKKIRYNEATNEIALKNWNKYNSNTSTKVEVFVKKELEKVKDRTLIQYIYSMDTVSILNPQEEEEKEEEKEEKPETKLEFDLSFVDSRFSDIFKTWLKYKKDNKQSFKNEDSLKACYNKIIKLSNNDPIKAKEVIENSMSNNWAGLYALKNENNKNNSNTQQQTYNVTTIKHDAIINPALG